MARCRRVGALIFSGPNCRLPQATAGGRVPTQKNGSFPAI